ncbi:MAG: hypothetical protein LBI18_11065 [Planctomycetaceae bacterium]|jgi:hypothetical protein|nr:hypothetical protein [Planctomycetaceae bacterium]
MNRETAVKLIVRLIVWTQEEKIQWQRLRYDPSVQYQLRDIPYSGIIYTVQVQDCHFRLYQIKQPGNYPGETYGQQEMMKADPDYLFKIALDVLDANGDLEYAFEPIYAMVGLFEIVREHCAPSLKKIETLLAD